MTCHLRRFAKWAFLVYVIGLIVLTLLQRWMLFPRHSAPPIPNAGADVPGLEKQWLDTDDGPVEAWFLPGRGVSASSPGPAVIFAHGNAELIDYLPPFVEGYLRMGISVLAVEYRGYGRSAGSPSQAVITQDYVAFYDRLVERADVNRDQIGFHGRSLGGGVACALAKERPPAALILQSTFTSVIAMARGYLMPSFLVSDPFDNLETIRGWDLPVLIVHGRRDQMIAYKHAEALHAAAPQSRLVTYDCNHNDCPPNLAVFWGDVQSFLTGIGW